MFLTLEKSTSGPEPQKHTYEIGEHVLGRGPELQCTSKKVSRKHALLKVQDDGVFLESTHNNPCYRQPKNEKTIQIVSFNKKIKLNHEDKIALALDHGWFITKITKSIEDENELPSDTNKQKRELDKSEASEAKKIKLDGDNVDADETVEVDVSVRSEVIVAETVPQIESEIQIPERTETIEEETVEPEVPEIKQEPLNESINEPEIKQEPLDTSTEVTVKEEPDNQDTSTEVTVKDEPKNSDKQDTNAASTSLGNSSRRERCWYGSSCYRKNPTHRATFSHPNDTDYDSDPNDTRPICCYGINCYRRNKLHRNKYRHPGQTKIADPPNKNNKRKQPKSPKVKDSTKTRKAKTKTVDYYDDDEEDDYDLDDPFINDGDTSDEYEPDSSDTESEDEESSQSQNTEDIEDTKQLLKDARKFRRI